MALPLAECETLNNKHLAVVAAQVSFPPLPRFTAGSEVDQSYTAQFAESVRRYYPRYRQEHQLQIVFNEQGVQTTNGEPILRFADIDAKWSISLSKEFLTLESFAYNGIRDFTQRLSYLTRTAKELFGIDYQLRVGLRFVNELRRPNGADYSTWWSLLNPDVIGYNPEELFDGKVRNIVNEVTVQREDGTMRMRRGFLQGTTVRRIDGKPPTESSHFYLIDLDYFDETAKDFQTDHSELLFRYNEYLFRVFRWLVSDKLYAELKK